MLEDGSDGEWWPQRTLERLEDEVTSAHGRVHANSQRILDLARSDGWYSVFDFSDPSSRSIEDGKVIRLADALGNLPDLVSAAPQDRPRLLRDAFTGLSGGMFGDGGGHHLSTSLLSKPLNDELFILTVAQSDRVGAGSRGRFVLDGKTASGRHAILASTRGGNAWAMFGGREMTALNAPLDTEAHVIGAQFSGKAESQFYVDGHLQPCIVAPGGFDHRFTGITLGDRFSGEDHHWVGRIGPVLIFRGLPTLGVRERMTRLLQSMISACGPVTSDVLASAAAFSSDSTGNIIYEKNATSLQKAASLTKMLTAYLVRQKIVDAQLDDTVELKDDEPVSGSIPALLPGDRLSYRDLLHLIMLPSHNAAARVLARAIGEGLTGPGGPEHRFLTAMNDLARAWGWTGATFSTPSGLDRTSLMSAKMAAELLLRIADEDPVLLQIMGTLKHRVRISGPHARNITARHTINPSGFVHFSEFIAGKTGTLPRFGGSVALLTTAADGSLVATVTMMALPLNARYEDARKVIDGQAGLTVRRGPETAAADASVAQALEDRGSLTRSALDKAYVDHPRTTGVVDLEIREAELRSRGARIAIQRRGDSVELMLAAVGLPENASIEFAVPPGFRPVEFAYGTAFSRDRRETCEIQVFRNGRLEVRGNLGKEPLRGTLVWLTDEGFPASTRG